MNISIQPQSNLAIYEQLVEQFKDEIIKGNLKEGDIMPSIRALAKELRISVITTKRAYEDLERDGFITTVVGKGSFVKAADTSLVREERLKQIEELLGRAVVLAGESGIRKEEVLEILEILFQDN